MPAHMGFVLNWMTWERKGHRWAHSSSCCLPESKVFPIFVLMAKSTGGDEEEEGGKAYSKRENEEREKNEGEDEKKMKIRSKIGVGLMEEV